MSITINKNLFQMAAYATEKNVFERGLHQNVIPGKPYMRTNLRGAIRIHDFQGKRYYTGNTEQVFIAEFSEDIEAEQITVPVLICRPNMNVLRFERTERLELGLNEAMLNTSSLAQKNRGSNADDKWAGPEKIQIGKQQTYITYKDNTNIGFPPKGFVPNLVDYNPAIDELVPYNFKIIITEKMNLKLPDFKIIPTVGGDPYAIYLAQENIRVACSCLKLVEHSR